VTDLRRCKNLRSESFAYVFEFIENVRMGPMTCERTDDVRKDGTVKDSSMRISSQIQSVERVVNIAVM